MSSVGQETHFVANRRLSNLPHYKSSFDYTFEPHVNPHNPFIDLIALNARWFLSSLKSLKLEILECLRSIGVAAFMRVAAERAHGQSNLTSLARPILT